MTTDSGDGAAPYGPGPIPEFIYDGGTCPECLEEMQANVSGDKKCHACGYTRARPDKNKVILGIAGDAYYPDVRDQLLHITATLSIGKVWGLMHSNVAEPLSLDLHVDVSHFVGGWLLNIRDCTHVLSVGNTPAIAVARDLGKPLRKISPKKL